MAKIEKSPKVNPERRSVKRKERPPPRKAIKMLLELCLERADNDDDRAELVTQLAECETRLEEYPQLMS